MNLFERHDEVINVVKPRLELADEVWDKVRHYYARRNKRVHERATLQITDTEVEGYRKSVEPLLKELFDLNLRTGPHMSPLPRLHNFRSNLATQPIRIIGVSLKN